MNKIVIKRIKKSFKDLNKINIKCPIKDMTEFIKTINFELCPKGHIGLNEFESIIVWSSRLGDVKLSFTDNGMYSSCIERKKIRQSKDNIPIDKFHKNLQKIISKYYGR